VPRYGDYEEAYDLGIRKYYKAAGQVCINTIRWEAKKFEVKGEIKI
jgi:hypothetical protein